MATAPSNIRVNTSVPFPALVRGKGPITVEKHFGIWDIGFDAALIGIVIPQLADYPTSYMIVYNSVTGALELVSLSSIVGGGGTDVTVDLVTTNATPANFPTTILSIPYQSWGFDGEIIARDVQTGDSSLWSFTGALKQMADASTTELVSPITPTVVMQDAGAAAWGISISADTTGGTLQVQAQGETARTIYWELRVKSEHVTTPAPVIADASLFTFPNDGSIEEIATLAATNGTDFSLSYFFNPNSSDLGNLVPIRIQNGGAVNVLKIIGSAADQISITLKDAAGTSLITVESTSIGVVNKWHSVVFSVDTNHAAGLKVAKLYIDRVDCTGTIIDANGAFTITSNGTDFQFGNIQFPAAATDVGLTSLWVAPGQTLLTAGDIPSGTLDKFVTSGGAVVDLGPDGSIPTGTIPAVYATGAAADIGTNLGNGGSLVQSGTVPTDTPGPP